VVRLSKRLGEDIIKEMERNMTAFVIIYGTENITPWLSGYDQKSVSRLFWETLVNHLRQNVKYIRIFLVCDSMAEECEPIEGITEASVICQRDKEGQTIIRMKEENRGLP
jgi:hypothetical protein